MSSDSEALAHLRERVRLDAEARDRDAAIEADAICRQASVKGNLGSGNTIAQLCRQALDDLRIRSELHYKALTETWASYNPTPQALDEACAVLLDAYRVAANSREADIRTNGAARSINDAARIFSNVFAQFHSDAENGEKRLALRLREWELRMKRPANAPGATQITNVTLTGDGNNVVAGLMGSTAHIELDPASRDRLSAALAQVKDAIQRTQTLPEGDAQETLELVEDAEREAAKPQPNKRRLAASLSAVATSIQTVGALGEAYGVLKNAMALVGLPLP